MTEPITNTDPVDDSYSADKPHGADVKRCPFCYSRYPHNCTSDGWPR